MYKGPSSKELAAAEAASRLPPGPRPLLGDVLLEVVHSDDVKRSSKANGAVDDDPISKSSWLCIMRHRTADGYVCSMMYMNLFYLVVSMAEPL